VTLNELELKMRIHDCQGIPYSVARLTANLAKNWMSSKQYSGED